SLRSTDVGASLPRPQILGEETSPLQNGLQPAVAAAGVPSRSEEGPRPFILAMNSNNGNGDRPRSPSRGEATLPGLVLWDPYRIEGMPEDALKVKIDGPPQNLAERIFTEICRNLNAESPRPMVIGLEIEKARDFKENELENALMSFLRN